MLTRSANNLLVIGAAALAGCAGPQPRDPAMTKHREPEGEERKFSTGISFASRIRVEASPAPSGLTPGFDSERAWSGSDDWEPFVAADPSSDYVYQLTTRLTLKTAEIIFRRSSNNGETWERDQSLAPVRIWQADPQIQVANDGTVYALWLDGPDYSSKLIKSFDHGDTWTQPVNLAERLAWTDHGWLVISPDGKDVYIGLNKNNSYMLASHDYGETFGQAVKTSFDLGRWWLHTGGAVAPNGDVRFAVVNYPAGYDGRYDINMVSSFDGGLNWETVTLETAAVAPPCDWAEGCTLGFLSPTAGLAIDSAGRVMVAYNAAFEDSAPNQVWIAASLDGATWTPRTAISAPDDLADNAFPAVAAGPQPGDFRVVWQGDLNGDHDSWNTLYRRTTDGGATWGPILRLSDLPGGAPYKNRDGYNFPYGDYLGLSVDSDGTNHVIWGESVNYNGPGGTWYTRGQ